jgi:hypothetical protein
MIKRTTTGPIPAVVLFKNNSVKDAILALLNPEQKEIKTQCSMDLNMYLPL